MGGQITYECISTNPRTYRIRLTLYRDCNGISAPSTVTVQLTSSTCGSSTITLHPIPGTGRDITPVCPGQSSRCSGNNPYGWEEWVYEGTFTPPNTNPRCEWRISWSLCCRNDAITNLQSPGWQDGTLYAILDDRLPDCNNSPTFNLPPTAVACVGQQICINPGVTDPDGDDLVFDLTCPRNDDQAQNCIPYVSPYSPTNPWPSSTGWNVNSNTGTICFTPSQTGVPVITIRVREYRNGVQIGEYIRDIQVWVINCNNQPPVASGLNGQPYNPNDPATFTMYFCQPGVQQCATLNFSDPDPGQNVTVSWNGGIPGATFTVNNNNTPNPTATICWTPTMADTGSHNFVVQLMDDACPLRATSQYGYVIVVAPGFQVSHTAYDPTCAGATNGSITITPSGGSPPYQYSIDNGATWQGNNTFSGLGAGTYTILVRDASGCQVSRTVTLTAPPPIPVTNLSTQAVRCHGESNGSVSFYVSGGTGGYSFTLNGNPIVPAGGNPYTISGLAAGSYTLIVRDQNNCQSIDFTITQPAPLAFGNPTVDPVRCYGEANGSITVGVSGGNGGYTFTVNGQAVVPAGNNPYTFTGLQAGIYTIVVTDTKGCEATLSVTVPQPESMDIVTSVTPATCRESSDGSISVIVSGGNPPYQYMWSVPGATGSTLTGISYGSYTLTVTDVLGCTASVTVNVPFREFVDINLPSLTGCMPYMPVVSPELTGTGPYQILWETSDGQSGRDSIMPVFFVPGIYTLQVTAVTPAGCSSIVTVPVNVLPTPVAIYRTIPDTGRSIVVGDPFTLISVSPDAERVVWEIEGVGRYEGTQWQGSFSVPGRYCFTMYAYRGACVDSAKGCVEVVYPQIFVPTAFTPNGDGRNDLFEIFISPPAPYRCRIYDRWGVLVFDNQNDPSRFWDGTYQGKLVPEDAYVFVIEYRIPLSDKVYVRQGTVTLIR